MRLPGPEPPQLKGNGTADNGPGALTPLLCRVQVAAILTQLLPAGNTQAASYGCGREVPSAREWFFPVASSDNWDQHPHPRTCGSPQPTTSNLNSWTAPRRLGFAQVLKHQAGRKMRTAFQEVTQRNNHS